MWPGFLMIMGKQLTSMSEEVDHFSSGTTIRTTTLNHAMPTPVVSMPVELWTPRGSCMCEVMSFRNTTPSRPTVLCVALSDSIWLRVSAYMYWIPERILFNSGGGSQVLAQDATLATNAMPITHTEEVTNDSTTGHIVSGM